MEKLFMENHQEVQLWPDKTLKRKHYPPSLSSAETFQSDAEETRN